MTDIQTKLSKRLIEIRKSRGFSQQEVAELTGLKRPTIANIERGDQRPSIDFLIQFSQVTGVSIDEMAGIEGSSVKEVDQLITNFANDSRLEKDQLATINQIRIYVQQLEEEKSELNNKYVKALEEIRKIHQKLISQFKIKP